MLDRRTILLLTTSGTASWLSSTLRNAIAAVGSEAGPIRLLLVHGRDQQGQDPAVLKAAWIEALSRGARSVGRAFPDGTQTAFPFYGDALDDFAKRSQIPLTTEIRTKGEGAVDRRFLVFQAEIAEDLRRRVGITDQQVSSEYGPNPKQKGPENWEWVQAIIRAIDKYGGGISQSSLEIIMRDVFLYCTHQGIRDEIDRIVRAEVTTEPTVVIGHSLGSVVAYNILRTDPRALKVPLFVTLGSPLGIRAIRDELRPLRYPQVVQTWYNAFDPRDVVALYPLDGNNFPVTPAIENYGGVKNHTDNRHGIAGYLDDPRVAERILETIGT